VLLTLGRRAGPQPGACRAPDVAGYLGLRGKSRPSADEESRAAACSGHGAAMARGRFTGPALSAERQPSRVGLGLGEQAAVSVVLAAAPFACAGLLSVCESSAGQEPVGKHADREEAAGHAG
jgi:hypothetical protein